MFDNPLALTSNKRSILHSLYINDAKVVKKYEQKKKKQKKS